MSVYRLKVVLLPKISIKQVIVMNKSSIYESYERAVRNNFTAKSYREWLESVGYNVKCGHFTVDAVGGIMCTLCKPLVLCNGRCRHKTN